jgi:hypothetical protein
MFRPEKREKKMLKNHHCIDGNEFFSLVLMLPACIIAKVSSQVGCLLSLVETRKRNSPMTHIEFMGR